MAAIPPSMLILSLSSLAVTVGGLAGVDQADLDPLAGHHDLAAPIQT